MDCGSIGGFGEDSGYKILKTNSSA